MGIPHFFKYVLSRHAATVQASLSEPCHALMLDLNCAVHRCAETVRNAGVAETTRGVPFEELVIHAVLHWVEHVIANVCQPRDLLFVTLDGVPPRAKMVQQRSRRFISALSSRLMSRGPGGNEDSGWDSCCVTPGTPFMRALCERLHDARTRFQSLLPQSAQVRISDCTEPGEGEHKIFAVINDEPGFAERHPAIVVYGADADLLLLAMRSKAQRPFILREEHARVHLALSQSPGWHFVNIAALRQRVQRLVGSHEEFVVLCSLLGNDFVPPLSYLRVRERGLDDLIAKYNRLRAQHAGYRLTSEDASLSYASLLQLVTAVSESEDTAFAALDAAYGHARRQPGGPSRAGQPFASDPWVLALEDRDAPESILPGESGWRPRYYGALFRNTQDDVAGLCERYLYGLAWTQAYYANYTASTARLSDWFYPHTYSPTAMDVANYLRTLGVQGFEQLCARAATAAPGVLTSAAIKDPSVQLLMVLPPSASRHLPEHLRGIPHDTALGCRHFYPSSFRLATYLKWHASDCHALLPEVDPVNLVNTVHRLQKRDADATKRAKKMMSLAQCP